MTFVSDGRGAGLLDVDDDERARDLARAGGGQGGGLHAEHASTPTRSTVQQVQLRAGRRGARRPPTSPGRRSSSRRRPWSRCSSLLPTALAEETGAPVTTVGYYLADARTQRGRRDRAQRDPRRHRGRRVALRRARLPGARRDLHPAAGALHPRWRADARRHVDGDLPGALRRPSGPRDPGGRGGGAALAARGRRVVRPGRRLRRCRPRCAVGFIPGIAITYPLTQHELGLLLVERAASVGPFLDVPWLLILGLVVALPLLTAADRRAHRAVRLPLARLT